MSVNSLSAPVAAGGHRAPKRCMVDPGLLRTLQAKGLERPVRGMCDARLDYPELLLLHGFNYELGAEGSRYVCEAADDCGQTVEYGPGEARRVITSCEGRTQVLSRDAEGRFHEEWRKSLPSGPVVEAARWPAP